MSALKKRKWEPEKRLVAIEHDEERRAQGSWPKSAPAGFEKDIVEPAEQVGFFVPFGKALLVESTIAVPERGMICRIGITRHNFPALPELLFEEWHPLQPVLDQSAAGSASLRTG